MLIRGPRNADEQAIGNRSRSKVFMDDLGVVSLLFLCVSRATEPMGVGKGVSLRGHGAWVSAAVGRCVVMSGKLGEGAIADLCVSHEADRESGAQAVRPFERPSLKVLVVDDEPLLTMTTADMLTDLGHRPIEAESGPRALEILKEHADVDLMITDHAMPGMSGIDLARQALQLRPTLKVILATGYDNLPKDLGIALERLPKPYFEHDLSAAIDRLVSSGRG